MAYLNTPQSQKSISYTNKDYNTMFHRNFNPLIFEEKPDLSFATIMDSQTPVLGSSATGGAAGS